MDKVKFKCQECSQDYYLPMCVVKNRNTRGGSKFCSKECKNGHQVNKKFTDERKNNISKSKFGVSIASKGKPAPHKVGENNPSWKGGRVIKRNYIYLKMREHPYSDNQGYVCEHRYCAEAYLGRFLSPKEVIHHIDNDSHNNIPENLYLFSSQSTHMKYHQGILKNKTKLITKSNITHTYSDC